LRTPDLDQDIGTIWHKRSMLVNDNTAECGIQCFSRKKETIYDGAKA